MYHASKVKEHIVIGARRSGSASPGGTKLPGELQIRSGLVQEEWRLRHLRQHVHVYSYIYMCVYLFLIYIYIFIYVYHATSTSPPTITEDNDPNEMTTCLFVYFRWYAWNRNTLFVRHLLMVRQAWRSPRARFFPTITRVI